MTNVKILKNACQILKVPKVDIGISKPILKVQKRQCQINVKIKKTKSQISKFGLSGALS